MLLPALEDACDGDGFGDLFAQLGYTKDVLPADADGLQLIARWRGFKVMLARAGDPRDRVRGLCRHLATRGERAMAVCYSDQEMALAAPRLGQPGTTRVLIVSRRQPTPLALHQLERLRPNKTETALALALRVTETLSSEAAGQQFFTAFRVQVERVSGCLTHQASSADRKMVALLALTRILFLYFVQAKGWLDGRSDYLRARLDDALAHGYHFHRSVLNPLFFGTLNRPPDARSKSARHEAIPYLNGGLFERHPTERRIGPYVFPNALWRDVFDDLFERYHFCVREAEEVDAIAPDMLGRVFERLMAGDERLDSGTFYTPESAVQQVVRAAIETVLTTTLNPTLAAQVVQGESIPAAWSSRVSHALRQMRILDPAVGSGAFLLGALEALCDMRIAAEPAPRVRSRLRREILRENLFGVDLNPVAVRLAELRLWLAIIADDPTTNIRRVAPLPNLDGVVRQGDSLLDPIAASRQFTGSAFAVSNAVTHISSRARHAVFRTHGPAQRVRLRRLRRLEATLAKDLVEWGLTNTERVLEDLHASARSPDLFGKHQGLTKSQRVRHRALKATRAALKRAKRQVSNDTIPFFSYEVHAPDVMARGGFSAVIGNPPWVRAERLSHGRKRALAHRFRWWRSSASAGFSHLPDLAVAFLERSLELTAPDGALALLVPSKFTSAGYAETARRALVRETTLQYLHRIPAKEAAQFGATTYPLALIAQKRKPDPAHAVRLDLSARRNVQQRTLDEPGPWLLLGRAERGALDQLRAAGRPLGRLAPPQLGVKTGANHIFLGRLIESTAGRAAVRVGTTELDVEQAFVRFALRGRDVRPFTVELSHIILWTHDTDGQPLATLPVSLTEHFQRHRGKLQRRADYRDGPLWRVFRTVAATARHRVVWSDIARRPRAVALDETHAGSAVPMNTCYVVAAPARDTALLIAAVLNSIWTHALVSVTADEARGGYRRFNARAAEQVPVPTNAPGQKRLIELSRMAHRGSSIQLDELDEVVAHALALRPHTRHVLRSLAENHS